MSASDDFATIAEHSIDEMQKLSARGFNDHAVVAGSITLLAGMSASIRLLERIAVAQEEGNRLAAEDLVMRRRAESDARSAARILHDRRSADDGSVSF